MFTIPHSEASGNLAFRGREGYRHDGKPYSFNALRFFRMPEGHDTKIPPDTGTSASDRTNKQMTETASRKT